jgi:hypothetical protein
MRETVARIHDFFLKISNRKPANSPSTTVSQIKPDATDTLHQHAFAKFIASRARKNIKDYHHDNTIFFENVKQQQQPANQPSTIASLLAG